MTGITDAIQVVERMQARHTEVFRQTMLVRWGVGIEMYQDVDAVYERELEERNQTVERWGAKFLTAEDFESLMAEDAAADTYASILGALRALASESGAESPQRAA